MADTIRFNIKLNIEGKDVVVQASESVKELQKNLGLAKDKVTQTREALISFNQAIDSISNINGAIQQTVGTLNSLTAESRSFSAAMASANTMAGKSRGPGRSHTGQDTADC